jgi:hypothetical protein
MKNKCQVGSYELQIYSITLSTAFPNLVRLSLQTIWTIWESKVTEFYVRFKNISLSEKIHLKKSYS